MYLIRLKVQGYRSLYEEPPPHDGRVATDVPATFDDAPGVEIRLDRLTVLIGCNDTGKSSVLDLIDIVLNRGQPDVDDFHRPLSAVAGHEANLVSQPVDTIQVHLEFQVEGERDADVNTFAVDGLLLLRIVYTPVGVETHYLGPTPVDQRLAQEFDKMKAHDQIELIRDLDATALDGLSNIPQRAQWLENFANAAPKQLAWLTVPRTVLESLPRFERYTALDYDDPSGLVLKTLKQVYESVIYEDVEINGETMRRPVQSLRDLKTQVESRIHDKVQELMDHIRRYNPSVAEISYDPTIDFSGGLKQGQFQINDGHGLKYLSKVGDGTKRRMFMAVVDWDREVTLADRTTQARLPSVIRGYDEPDTNLDYRAQRTMYQSISDIVYAAESRFQAVVCTHSPRLVDQAPAPVIRLLQWQDGRTSITRLHIDNDPEVETFLCCLARELGLSNTLMFYERCFILIEGETEENALPLLYRTVYGHSLVEDGVRVINVQSNGAFKEFFRLMSRNRQNITLVFTDLDTDSSPAGKTLTKQILREAHFSQQFVESHVYYVPEAIIPENGTEFEAAFSDATIATCLQSYWPKAEGDWTAGDVSSMRLAKDKKFSDEVKSAVWNQSREGSKHWSKPEFGRVLGSRCDLGQVPEAVLRLFTRARELAGSLWVEAHPRA